MVEDVPLLYVPNAFSPNGDNINDKFNFVVNGIDVESFTFRIYNRWGEVVFENNDSFDKEWDGTLNGELLPSEVYVWKFVGDVSITGRKQKIEETGSILIMR